MTREELIDYVEFLRSQNEISYDVYSRLIDGIDTLEQESCDHVISREYLVEHIKACWTNGRPMYSPNLSELLSWIDDVPLVQPKPIECEDAISRQTAIDIVRHECGEWKGLAKEIVKQFNGLPPVQPKMAHWIDINNHHYYNDGDIETTELRCSCCNEVVEWDIESLHKPRFCENCGCRMIEPQESEGI